MHQLFQDKETKKVLYQQYLIWKSYQGYYTQIGKDYKEIYHDQLHAC